jgi:hypothetical protein
MSIPIRKRIEEIDITEVIIIVSERIDPGVSNIEYLILNIEC